MVFEIVDKAYMVGKRMGDYQISINSCGVTFGKGFKQFLSHKQYLELYFDIEGKRMGFKPTNDQTKGFKVGREKNGNDKTIVTGVWAKRLKRNRHDCEQINDMLIVNNIEISLKPIEKVKELKIPNSEIPMV